MQDIMNKGVSAAGTLPSRGPCRGGRPDDLIDHVVYGSVGVSIRYGIWGLPSKNSIIHFQLCDLSTILLLLHQS